jgi:hypothetical protein
MKDAHVRGKEIITTDIKYLVVEGEAIDIIRFPITRMYAGHDLNDAVIHCYFEFEDGSGGFDLLTKELSPGGELVYAYWQVKGNATSKSGKLQIQLKARKDSTVIWRTKRATIIVEASLSPDELGEFTPTILDQYLALYQGLVDDAEAARDKAENWAEEAEDVEVEEGMYSAKHHSAKAAAAQSAAEGARDGAEGLYGDLAAVEAAKLAAQTARDKAESWSEADEDVEVEEGMYSAKHHSAKAAASAAGADESEYQALLAKQAAQAAQGLAEGAKDDAEIARDNAEALYGDLAAVEAAKLAAQEAQGFAEEAKDDAEAARDQAALYAAELDDSLMPTHLAAVMPHQIVDQDNLVTYRYGFKIQNGDLVFLSEEVV